MTPRVAKYHLYVWCDAGVCPDSATIAIARDDVTFGILHSRFHEALTRLLVDLGAVPRQASADAARIAIAAANGVDYLVTWNFKHIANASMRSRIERAGRL